MTGKSGGRRHYQYKRYGKCKQCKVQGTYSKPLSARGLCYGCGEDRMTDAIEQMAEGVGPVAEKWRWNLTAFLIAGTGVTPADLFMRDVSEEGCSGSDDRRNLA